MLIIRFFVLVCLKCVTKNFYPAGMPEWRADCDCSLSSFIYIGCFPFLTSKIIQLHGPHWAQFSCSERTVWHGTALCRAWVLLFGRKGIPHIPVGFEQLYVRILTLPSSCGCFTEPAPPPPPPAQRQSQMRNVSKINRDSWGFMPTSQAFTGKVERKTVTLGIR